jgi:mycofactocin system glycosyltransferase
MPAEEVTVVIPVRDDPAGLAATLSSLAATLSSLARPARAAPFLDIVVVDDGSVSPVAAPANVTLVRRKHPGGPGAARNTGWRTTRAGIVVFLDAACEPQEDWLHSLLVHFADREVAAVAPRIVSSRRPSTRPWLAAYEARHSPLDLGGRAAPVRPGSAVTYVPTAALAVRRTALEEAGGFDEGLRFGEDVDLVWRLVKLGWQVRYEPAVVVTHPARPTASAWARQRLHYGQSAAPLAARHGRDVAPLTIAPWSAAAWGFVATGHPAAGLAVAVGSAATLARRASPDRPTALALAGLALRGNLRAGAGLAAAVRRAWLPPAVGVCIGLAAFGSARSRRASSAALAAALVGEAALEWTREQPGPGLVAWTAMRLADDLTYQAGVWAGVIRSRSIGALLPRRAVLPRGSVRTAPLD